MKLTTIILLALSWTYIYMDKYAIKHFDAKCLQTLTHHFTRLEVLNMMYNDITNICYADIITQGQHYYIIIDKVVK